MQQPNANRIEVVDALRGFAIMSIMLLHHLEHFDFWFFPENLPAWLKVVDGGIWKTMFFLFSGKAYTIFALLFGFTFFIMFNKQEQNGKDFRLRFVWRMLIFLLSMPYLEFRLYLFANGTIRLFSLLPLFCCCSQ
jgi:uncharacterized protein